MPIGALRSDVVTNSRASQAPSVLKQLRAGLGPDVPILVLEGHTYGNVH